MENRIEEIYKHFLRHPTVTTDSRRVSPGSVFFALRGDSFNGNEYAGKALESGASVAIVDEPGFVTSPACILVEDVLTTLQELASHHRLQFKIPVVAITGTNGKTTTKELVSRVLSKKYKTIATKGNLNNHIGVPLTLLEISTETEIAIIEMGANHPGEIEMLCHIANPGYGLITNIGKAHLEGFGSFEGVIHTKTELYRYLREKKGTIFLNRDDEVLIPHSAGIQTITYGSAGADLISGNITADPFVSMDIRYGTGEGFTIESRLYGRYNAANIQAAACIGNYFKIIPEDIKAAIQEYQPANNRSEVTKTARNLLILDAYNANPSSMKAAIESFAASAYPEKSIILGDMLELGKDTDEEHLSILSWIDKLAFKSVYLVGPVFTRLNTNRNFICFQDSELAKLWFEHHRPDQETLLIKGSRGIHLEKLVDSL